MIWNGRKCRLLLLKIGTGFLLLLLFTFHSVPQVLKYRDGKTTLTSDYKHLDDIEFPSILFCAKNSVLKANASILPKDDYLNFHLKPLVEFHGLFKTENIREELNSQGLKISFVPTLYNGLCKMFELLGKYHERLWLGFLANDTFEYSVFLLPRGHEFFHVPQSFMHMPTEIQLKSSVQIEISPKRYDIVDTTGVECHEYDSMDQIECIRGVNSQYLSDSTNDCISYPLEFISRNRQNTTCTNSSEAEITFLPVTK